MVKKIFVGIVIAAAFGALMLGSVNQVLANTDVSGSVDVDTMTLDNNADDPSGTPEEKKNEYLYQYTKRDDPDHVCECSDEGGACIPEMAQEQHKYEYQYKNLPENGAGNGEGSGPLNPDGPGSGPGDGTGMKNGSLGNGNGTGECTK